MTAVRRATTADAEVLARLLWDFNTEFETEVDDVDVLEVRFARLLELDDIVAVLAEDGSTLLLTPDTAAAATHAAAQGCIRDDAIGNVAERRDEDLSKPA